MTLLTIERVAVLRRSALFAAVPEHVLAGVARVLLEVPVAVGDVVLEEGDEGDSMLVVASGRVKVHRGGATVVELGSGGTIGELSVLVAERRAASVTAIEPGILLRLQREVFEELLADHPELARSVIRMLVGIVRERAQGSSAGQDPDVAASVP